MQRCTPGPLCYNRLTSPLSADLLLRRAPFPDISVVKLSAPCESQI